MQGCCIYRIDSTKEIASVKQLAFLLMKHVRILGELVVYLGWTCCVGEYIVHLGKALYHWDEWILVGCL